MGTFKSWKKAYGALKDSTTVGLAKVNSEYKELDVAIIKATSHVEVPPKERHIRKIFSATSVLHPRADIAYCVRALARRLSKTKNWIVALKTLIVIHRTLREGDPTFREELINYSSKGRGQVLHLTNFKDDSSALAWDCSAWVRAYALFLDERLQCFKVLKYDIESERLTKLPPGRGTKVQSRTRLLDIKELLEHLPALQQLLYRLNGCQPEGAAYGNLLIQYPLALVLKESFKIYCAINDGIINLVDVFFEMSRSDAAKAFNIYRRAGQQADGLADFYDYCRGLELARNFQFPKLRQPPPSFLVTMEEYLKEASQAQPVDKRVDYEVLHIKTNEPQEPSDGIKQEIFKEEDKHQENAQEEPQTKEKLEVPPLITIDDTEDFMCQRGLNEINPKAVELEESNALAIVLVQPDSDPQMSANHGWDAFGEPSTSGWELALLTAPSNSGNHKEESKLGYPTYHADFVNVFTDALLNVFTPKPNERHLLDYVHSWAGGFDKLLLDSLYEDDVARRHIQLQSAGIGHGHPMQNSFEQQSWMSFEQQSHPFALSNNVVPHMNMQMAVMSQHHQHQRVLQQQMVLQQQQQMMMQQQQQMVLQQHQHHQQQLMLPQPYQQYVMATCQHQPSYPQQEQQMQRRGNTNPFGDPFNFQNSTPSGNHGLL